ncbi:MAG: hypothetical protein O3B86_19900, partial [Planctomycetota bacterium]|nr:hypothetical protein [Planctomycetota bacterium]
GILVCEIFIPSAGILTMLSIVCYAGATFCAWRGWYQTGHTAWWWGYVLGMLVLLPSAISGAVYILPRTAYGKAIFASPQSLAELTPFLEEEARLTGLINSFGRAATMFSPGGMVQIGQEKFHAESDGVLIEAGQDVVVVGVKGNRLVVMPAERHASIAKTEPTPKTAAIDQPLNTGADPYSITSVESSGDDPIDFDIPETV